LRVTCVKYGTFDTDEHDRLHKNMTRLHKNIQSLDLAVYTVFTGMRG
jgi:hypothetical protein